MNKSLIFAFLIALLHSSNGYAQQEAPSWQIGVFAGPYKPVISETNSAQKEHYELYYGDDEAYLFKDQPVMMGIEYTWFVWDQFGLLGLNSKVGTWSVRGMARRCLSGPSTDSSSIYINCNVDDPSSLENTVAGTTQTQLRVMPLQLGLVYRFNYLHQKFGFPMEAYLKAGLDYSFWWASTDNKEAIRPATASRQEQVGFGGTAGYHYGGGISFNLDWLDPQTASRGRATSEIAGSFLFFEANTLVIAGFKEPSRLNLSATQFTMGIAIDFL